MKILFLSVSTAVSDINNRGIYPDLINYFKDKVEPNKKFKIPNDKEKEALKNLVLKLEKVDQKLNPF